MIETTIDCYGGNAPSSYIDGAGVRFWGLLNRNGQNYEVWKQRPGAAVEKVPLPAPLFGQGRLCVQPDGRLEAVAHVAVGHTPPRAVTVPGWTIYCELAAVLNEDGTQETQAEIMDDGLFGRRYYRLRMSLAQVRRILRALGHLR